MTPKDEEEKEAASVQPAASPENDESSLSTDSRREPGNRTLEGCLEGERSRTDIKGKKNKP